MDTVEALVGVGDAVAVVVSVPVGVEVFVRVNVAVLVLVGFVGVWVGVAVFVRVGVFVGVKEAELAAIERLAVPVAPPLSTASFLTKLPTVHEPITELIVKLTGRSQSPIIPTFHLTVLPVKSTVPLLGLPTTATLLKQEGTLSVIVTVSEDIDDTTRFLNAVDPALAWKPNVPLV
jgi:hypothetical protein